MLLNYFKGQNFGDALNPIVFNQLLPDFFDEDPEIEFSGIGSILGLPMHEGAKRRIIFSSGFAYGSIPKIDNTYDIVCVRGPLTTKALNIDKKLAVTDGAILLSALKFKSRPKKYNYSFMPHWESELKYPWEKLCKEADINYISPTLTPEQVIDQILESDCIIAEAMHAAIVADTLRVPWLAVKAYNGINEFKWHDWTQSLSLAYSPRKITSMYSPSDFVTEVFRKKSGLPISESLIKLNLKGYEKIQDLFIKKGTVKQLQGLKGGKFQLSEQAIFTNKLETLLDKLYATRKRYSDKPKKMK